MVGAQTPRCDRQEELERRILYGLTCEWEAARSTLHAPHRQQLRPPLFSLGDMHRRWGWWHAERREIRLSRELVLRHSWDSVREVLLHEMAHQFAAEVLGAQDETAHGPAFREACELLRANPRACDGYPALDELAAGEEAGPDDRVMVRVRKLLALAESPNRHEAEIAMAKACQLVERHNLDLLARREPREFHSLFLGAPALRHGREDYLLALLIQDFYFVRGIWVSAFVLSRGRMGRVLEISGTLQNVRLAAYVHDFVRNFIHSQWTAYNRAKGLDRHRRRDFAVGILEGFRSRLEAMVSRRPGTKGTHRALVRMADPELDRYFVRRYPRTVTVRGNACRQDRQVLEDGRELGKTLVIHKGIERTASRGRLLRGA